MDYVADDILSHQFGLRKTKLLGRLLCGKVCALTGRESETLEWFKITHIFFVNRGLIYFHLMINIGRENNSSKFHFLNFLPKLRAQDVANAILCFCHILVTLSQTFHPPQWSRG